MLVRRGLVLLAGLLVSRVALAVDSHRATAFSLHEPPANRLAMRLHLGDRVFRTLGYGPQSWNRLAAAALARWNAAGIGVSRDHQFFTVGAATVPGNPCHHDDGINEVRWSTDVCGLEWGDLVAITFWRTVDGRTGQVDGRGRRR